MSLLSSKFYRFQGAAFTLFIDGLLFVFGSCRAQGPREGGGDLQVVRDAQVRVEVEQGGGDIAADRTLLGLAGTQVYRVDVSGQGT